MHDVRESKTSVNSESNQYLDILVSNSEKRVKKEPDIFSFIEFSPIKPDLSMSNNPHREDEALTSYRGAGSGRFGAASLSSSHTYHLL